MRWFAALLALVLALGVATTGWAHDDDDDDDDDDRRGRRRDVVEFDHIDFFFEFNSTDEDLGIQLSLGADPWNELKIIDPNGKKILETSGKGNLKDFGLSSFFFESNEPSFDDMSMEEILELFPEGEYKFVGRTIDGDRLRGTADLTHDIPDAPVICEPEDGDVVDPDDVVITSYQVIVTNDEDPAFEYNVRLPADATSLSVPPEFFLPDTEYELEVLAVEDGGNQTISVVFFTTDD
jgi:hypothetical protein